MDTTRNQSSKLKPEKAVAIATAFSRLIQKVDAALRAASTFWVLFGLQT
jgi:hypothetical protein